MFMEAIDKIVEFDKYCKTCIYSKYKEDEEPCCFCLVEPTNTYSHKPVKHKEKK